MLEMMNIIPLKCEFSATINHYLTEKLSECVATTFAIVPPFHRRFNAFYGVSGEFFAVSAAALAVSAAAAADEDTEDGEKCHQNVIYKS